VRPGWPRGLATEFSFHEARSEAFHHGWFQMFCSASSAVPLVLTKLTFPARKGGIEVESPGTTPWGKWARMSSLVRVGREL